MYHVTNDSDDILYDMLKLVHRDDMIYITLSYGISCLASVWLYAIRTCLSAWLECLAQRLRRPPPPKEIVAILINSYYINSSYTY